MTAPFDDARVPAFADAWQFLHPGEGQPATLGVHDCDQWPDPFACDFIFATQRPLPAPAHRRGRRDDDASDHQPVLVELG